MEFFAIADVQTDQEILKQRLNIPVLPDWCASINEVISADGDEGEIYSVWGQFIVRREEINGGVRFTLPSCPNGFAWTVTTGYPPSAESIVVHCTINRTEYDEDFIKTLQDFADDWKTGLEGGLGRG